MVYRNRHKKFQNSAYFCVLIKNYSIVINTRNPLISNLDNLTCRRIVEENHSDCIIQLLEEKPRKNGCQYVATISPSQVNIYDNEDKNTRIGFFAHYVVEQSPYFKGGNCTYGCWLYSQSSCPRDSIIAVGTSEGEIFLLSCIECRVIYVFPAQSSSPIVSISVSKQYSDYLFACDASGNLYIWNTVTKELVFKKEDLNVKEVYDCQSQLLLQMKDRTCYLVDLSTFTISELDCSVTMMMKEQRLHGILYIEDGNKWIFIFSTEFAIVDGNTHDVTHVQLESSLADYIDMKHINLSSNQKLITISEHSRSRLYSIEGNEIFILVDNYGIGTQNKKDQCTYHKGPISSCIVHPNGKYANMIENNRILRFDSINPDDHYVSHVVFPHPVEDMYLFYNSLNSEPLLYLHPKVNSNGKMDNIEL